MPTNREYHEPVRIQPKSLDDYLEMQSKPVFQAGMSWRVVESKWPELREAMQNFQAGAVASFGEEQIDALADDPRMIRSRRKIAAIVHNAGKLIELDEKHRGLPNYLRSFKSYDDLAADIKKQFKFMGEMGIYYWLYVVGEKVPTYEEYKARTEKK
jgi:3-methyladenine DNA glycosylase Tag